LAEQRFATHGIEEGDMSEHEKKHNAESDYLSSGPLDDLPDTVKRELDAHLAQYLKDPEGAHMWDPIVIGVPGGPVQTLLLTYTGRKSGKTLSTALQYYKLGKQTAIVASKGGTVEHPSWYLNLLTNPECMVQIGTLRAPARARTVEGEERARWWASISKEQPVQLQYQARTPRLIPIVVLDLSSDLKPLSGRADR
jgi:deazaflavin-dependent oxidoreductase (nitroreductase family)